jgi:hypothetical protein
MVLWIKAVSEVVSCDIGGRPSVRTSEGEGCRLEDLCIGGCVDCELGMCGVRIGICL